jgi:hypothetical protein
MYNGVRVEDGTGTEEGQQMTDVRVYTSPAGYVALEAPYDPALPPRAKALGGRWNPGARIWSFTSAAHDNIVTLAREIYGHCATDAPAEPIATTEMIELRRMSLETRIANASRRLAAARDAGDDAAIRILEDKITDYQRQLAAL